MERDFLPTKKVCDFFNKNFVFLNTVSGQKVNQLVEGMYNVASHPTFLFLDGDGKELARFSGAAKDVDKFVARVAKYTKKENWRDVQKKKFLSDKSYGEKYLRYVNECGLKDELEPTLNVLYNRYKGDKEKQKDLLADNVKGMAVFALSNVNGSIFNYIYTNEKEAKEILKLDDQFYVRIIGITVSNSIKNMLLAQDYSDKDYNKVLEIFKQKPQLKQMCKLQFEAIKPAKEKGLKGIIEVYEQEVFKLSSRDRLYTNFFFIRNFGHMVNKNAALKKYIQKCYDMDKDSRSGKYYKDLLGQ